MKILRRLLYLVLIMLTVKTQANIGPRIVLTTKENGLEAEGTFTCSDRIHGYVVLPQAAIGKHVLESVWVMPNGQINQQVKIPLEFPSPGRQTAYVWFRFLDKSGGILGGITSRSSSEEISASSQFNGNWHVQIKWDDKPLIEKNFTVKC